VNLNLNATVDLDLDERVSGASDEVARRDDLRSWDRAARRHRGDAHEHDL